MTDHPNPNLIAAANIRRLLKEKKRSVRWLADEAGLRYKPFLNELNQPRFDLETLDAITAHLGVEDWVELVRWHPDCELYMHRFRAVA